jgi:DNA-binding transcriptional LysR family regulator
MKAELELRQLRVFAAVVDAGTHTRAARALGLSQSTVSETLSALERTLGVPLFRKAAKGMALTASGQILLSYARRMSALTSELVGALADASSDVKATLVVSAVESVSAYVLPSRLAALRARWPGVRVEVLTGSCEEIRDRVTEGASDVGLVLEPESRPEVDPILAKTRLLILAAPGHALAGHGATAEQLRHCDFYMCDAAGNYHQALRQLFDGAEVPAPRMQAIGTIEGVKRGILAGGTALGLLPEHAVEPELRDGVLTEVRVRPALPSVVLRAVLAPGTLRSAVVDDLLDSLRGSPKRGLLLTTGHPGPDPPLRRDRPISAGRGSGMSPSPPRTGRGRPRSRPD